jgi:hypothetical protein
MRHRLPRGDAPRPEKPAGEEGEPRSVVGIKDETLLERGAASIGDALALLLAASPRTTAAIVYFAFGKEEGCRRSSSGERRAASGAAAAEKRRRV